MDTPSPLADLALLSLVVAHGTDGDLDPRETNEVVRQLDVMSDWLEGAHSSSELSELVRHAVRAYGDVRVVGLDEVVSFTPAVNTASLGVMRRIGLRRDPGRDFDHPRVDATAYPELVRHLVHALDASTWQADVTRSDRS